MHKRFGHILFVTIFLLGTIAIRAPGIRANVSSCTASVSQHTAATNSSTIFQVSITNTSSSTINWIRVTQPSVDFGIVNNTASGWLDSSTPVSAYESSGALVPGDSVSVSITTQIGANPAAAANWQIDTSDDDGSSTTGCSGALDTEIIAAIPANIFNISVTDAQPDSITINWTTDTPTSSQVNYGLDSSYSDTTPLSTTLTEDHSVHITGLSTSTGYHFQVISVDNLGVSATSSDNTFLTAAAVTITPGKKNADQTVIGTPPLHSSIPIKSIPTEKIAPTIAISTSLSQPFKQAPVISGTAGDNEAVAVLQYSLDGGKNWLPVDSVTGLGTKKASFSFTPQNLQDGNYELSVNAIDTSSNQASTTPQTLVIDRLPPTVGGNVIAVGSQVLTPNQDNVISSLVGVDQKITLSVVGGPISVTIVTSRLSNETPLQSFGLVKSPDSGLWSGILSYSKAGTYQLVVNSIDGAGNKTSRRLNIINVNRAGEITSSKGGQVAAKVSVYVRDDETNSWTLWDGEAYDQPSPLSTTVKGVYGLFLPAGVYYLKVEATGYRTIVTRIFTLDNPDIINNDFKLSQKLGFDLGPVHLRLSLPTFGGSDFHKSLQLRTKSKSLIVDSALPQFLLKMTNGKNQATTDLFGQPTILSFVNTWSDSAAPQLESLGKVTDPHLNVRAISSGESLARVGAYTKLAGYTLPVIVDSDNVLFDQLNGSTIPVTYFIDRHGIVKKVMVGVLSKQELLQNVSL